MEPPPVDRRTREQIADDLRAALPEGWRQPAAQRGPGRALIEVCARFAELVVTRLNRAPQHNYLEFLNLLGVAPAPPVPARAPLTFTLSDGAPAGTLVPKGTQVAAPPQHPDEEAVVFETAEGVVITGSLAGVFVAAAGNYEDRTEDARRGGSAFNPFTATQPLPHELYLACGPEIVAAGAAELMVRFVATGNVGFWGDAALTWSCWDGESWRQLDSSPPVVDGESIVETALHSVPKLRPTAVHGIEAPWIRAAVGPRRTAGELAEVALRQVGIAPVVTGRERPLDQAVLNSAEVDVSRDFYPFGPHPAFGDCLYLAVPDELALPGAGLAVQGALLKALTSAPELLVDTWTESGWTSATDETTWTFSDALNLTLPAGVARTAAAGIERYWVRIRLRGDYGSPMTLQAVDKTTSDRSTNSNGVVVEKTTTIRGYEVLDTLDPPILSSARWTETQPGVAPVPVCVCHNDFGWRTISDPGAEAVISPFSQGPADSVLAALYVAFADPLDSRLTTLFVVAEPPPRANQLDRSQPAWDYWTDAGWLPLTVVDDTDGLTRSGPVRFVAPPDLAETQLFGRTGYWIRIQSPAKQADQLIRRILPNTVWATQAVTIEDELLGDGSGVAGQELVAARTPILPGEQVLVNEPGAGWRRWEPVRDFHVSEPSDRHYIVDRFTGVLRFGDGVAGRKLPPGSNNVRLTYRAGGGAQGNRPAGALTELRSAVPYVDSVTNHEPAQGGADQETVARVAELGPHLLRHNGRAVAAEDIEDLALAASAEVRRVRVVPPRDFDSIDLWTANAAEPATGQNRDAGGYQVIVVPDSAELRPAPTLGLLNQVASALRSDGAATAAVSVVGPEWIAVSVTATVVSTDPQLVRTLGATVVAAVDEYLHPLTGGPRGLGWEFGRLPRESDVYAAIQAIPGVDHVVVRKVTLTPEVSRAAGVSKRHLTTILREPPAAHVPLDNAVRGWLDRALVYPGRHDIKPS